MSTCKVHIPQQLRLANEPRSVHVFTAWLAVSGLVLGLIQSIEDDRRVAHGRTFACANCCSSNVVQREPCQPAKDLMNIESRGGSLPPKSSDEWRAQLRTRKNVGQNFSPQVSYTRLACCVHLLQIHYGGMVERIRVALGCPAGTAFCKQEREACILCL